MLYKSKIGFKGHNIDILDESPDLVFVLVIFYGFYHGKSPSFTTIWEDMFFTFPGKSTQIQGEKSNYWTGKTDMNRDHHNETPLKLSKRLSCT